jgi:hypothetical protein
LGDIFGIVVSETGPQVPDQEWLMGAPQHTHGVAVAEPCPTQGIFEFVRHKATLCPRRAP